MDDPRLQDGVADNMDKFDLTESETLVIGTNFGIVTHIETGPDGNLYVVRLSDGTPNSGAIFQIARGQASATPTPTTPTPTTNPATPATGGTAPATGGTGGTPTY